MRTNVVAAQLGESGRCWISLSLGIGLVAALLGFSARFGISAYSLGDALTLAVHDLAGWLAAGLAVALIVKPAKEQGTPRVG